MRVSTTVHDTSRAAYSAAHKLTQLSDCANGHAVNDSLTKRPQTLTVAALYCFTPFTDCAAIRTPLASVCREHGIRGTLLLANEGINGTVAGPFEQVAILLQHIRELPGCSNLEVKLSSADAMPFHRMKIRIKREIVTMGEPDVDPAANAGTYVEPEDWNALISNPDTIVIDTRNEYETAVGSFVDAIDPKITSFRHFPVWFRSARDVLLGTGKQPRVAMFCTGGIRCEKSTAFLKQEGVEEVYHLKGGILKYLERVPEEASLWRGECFVFDERVTVGHGLERGTHELCRACRRPLNQQDLLSLHYEAGVSCAACHSLRTENQRASYRERHRQQALAVEEGRLHVGAVGPKHDADS